MEKLKIGYAPTRRFTFSAEDARRYKDLIYKFMREKYILAIDQSTSGTKALLFSQNGGLIGRCDRPHRQIVNARGWVEHGRERGFL